MNSGYTQSIFKEHISADIHVEILYPTIPDQRLPTLSNENETSINFLSINRFERKKDLVLALRAFAHLRKLLPDNAPSTHLYVIGGYDDRLRENVEYYDELQQLAADLHLDSSLITFVRSFSDQQKREYFSKAHCILYTPRFEHFGIVPVEAMQAGRPVIATATGGPLESIVDGRTGFLCDEPLIENFARRMKMFVEKKDLSREMGEQGRRHVQEKFSFQPFRKKLNEHVEELLKTKPVRGGKKLFYLFSFLFTLLFSLLMGYFFS